MSLAKRKSAPSISDPSVFHTTNEMSTVQPQRVDTASQAFCLSSFLPHSQLSFLWRPVEMREPARGGLPRALSLPEDSPFNATRQRGWP